MCVMVAMDDHRLGKIRERFWSMYHYISQSFDDFCMQFAFINFHMHIILILFTTSFFFGNSLTITVASLENTIIMLYMKVLVK